MKIKEIIVVEGKNDTNTLQRFLQCDTIETDGTNLTKEKLTLLKLVNEQRGIIIFTDPDAPGNLIRARINEVVKDAKNAFIMKDKAKTSKKVGIEHAAKEDIIEALSNMITFREDFKETISKEDLVQLGLNGTNHSACLRERIGNILFIGKCNAKTLYKRLNMLQIDKQRLIEIIEGLYE